MDKSTITKVETISVRLDNYYLAGMAILIADEQKAGIANPTRSSIIKAALRHLFTARGVTTGKIVAQLEMMKADISTEEQSVIERNNNGSNI